MTLAVFTEQSYEYLWITGLLPALIGLAMISSNKRRRKEREEQKKEQQALIDAIRGKDAVPPAKAEQAAPAVQPDPHPHSTSSLQRLKQRND